MRDGSPRGGLTPDDVRRGDEHPRAGHALPGLRVLSARRPVAAWFHDASDWRQLGSTWPLLGETSTAGGVPTRFPACDVDTGGEKGRSIKRNRQDSSIPLEKIAINPYGSNRRSVRVDQEDWVTSEVSFGSYHGSAGCRSSQALGPLELGHLCRPVTRLTDTPWRTGAEVCHGFFEYADEWMSLSRPQVPSHLGHKQRADVL